MKYTAALLGVALFGAILLAICATRSSSIPVDGSHEWGQFKLKYGKSYESADVESQKRKTFEFHRQLVERFNQEAPEAKSFQLQLNHLSDMSELEMRRINGFSSKITEGESPNSPHEKRFLDNILDDASIKVPESLDWRKAKGRVGEVKSQGNCGSCWAFAATGALEGQQVVRRFYTKPRWAGSVNPLSAQNFVDCVDSCSGCNGGTMRAAFRHISAGKGVAAAQSYPYEGYTQVCRIHKARPAMSDTGAATLPENDEEKLKEVVAKFGPVAVAIDASDRKFQLYGGGVYVSNDCGNKVENLNHAVLLVGYDSDRKLGDYWIVKNSWGAEWGEEGYIRMARSRKNMCGIATLATIPTF